MAVLEKSQLESITDRIAAMTIHQMSALLTQLRANTTLSLRDIIDSMGHPAAEICLEEAALALDHEMYPEHLYYLTYPTSGGSSRSATTGLINNLLSSSVKRKFVQDLNSFVMSEDGGGFQNLASAFAAAEARVHPAFGEIMMKNLGTTTVLSDGRASDIFAPKHDVITPDAVYVYDSEWTDDTTDATDIDASDVGCFAANNNMLAIGSYRKFSAAAIQIGTLSSSTITPEFFYSLGGSNYATATSGQVSDGTSGMTVSNLIQFNNLAGWSPTHLDMLGNEFDSNNRAPMYWIIIKRTKSSSIPTTPSLTMIHVVPEKINISATGRMLGLVTQPPLAIIRITAVNTMEVVRTYTPELVYFDYPEKLRLKALALPGSPAAATFTISYIDSNGASKTQAQSAWSSPSIATSFPSSPNYLTMVAEGGTRGIRTTGWEVTTTMASGVFAVTNDLERDPVL